MTTNRYFFDEGTFIADINGTDVTVGEARSISITPSAEHNEFYGPDSIKRQDVKRHTFGVDVEVEIAEFDEDWVQYWLNGGGVGGDTKATTINDTNDVALFNLTAEQPMTDGSIGSDSLKAVVNETHFPEMPAIDGTENEYSSRTMTGSAAEITFTKQ